MNKVAKITLAFWILKIIATTMGETLGDYFSQTLNLGYYIGLAITFLFFAIAASMQILSKKYNPYLFWLCIVSTTTFGTEISDFIDRTLNMGYWGGSILLLSVLLLSLRFWFKKYKNLEVYPIISKDKELLYWTAILFSNSLGTAFGDFLGDNIGLSYFQGAMVTGGIIIIVILLHYFSKINSVVLFWIAFIFTRPFGATFGDFLTKPLAKGGLDLGTLNASVVCGILLFFIITISNRKVKLEK